MVLVQREHPKNIVRPIFGVYIGLLKYTVKVAVNNVTSILTVLLSINSSPL